MSVTAMDMKNRFNNSKVSSSRKILIEVFSIIRNSERMLEVKQERGALDCLHGLRFLTAMYVVVGHRYFLGIYVPAVNFMDSADASILQ